MSELQAEAQAQAPRDASLVEITLNELESTITVNHNILRELENRLQSVLRQKEPAPMDDTKVSMEIVHSRVSENVKNQTSRIEYSNEKLRFLIDQLEI